MDLADITISPEFLLDNTAGPAAEVTDTSDYAGAGISNSQVKGNVTAKRGSTIYHDNPDGPTSFTTPDINRGTTDSVSFLLPVTANTGRVINGAYTMIYTIQITDEIQSAPTVTAPGASPFTTLQISGAGLAAAVTAIQNALAEGEDVTINIYAGDTLIETRTLISCSGGGLLTFASVTSASFASIDSAEVTATMVYDKTFEYDFCDVTPAACVEAPYDCLYSQMNVRDTTVYPSDIEGDPDRTLTVQFPRFANGSAADTTITTGAAAVTVGPDIWSGAYTISVSSILNWVQDDGLLIQDTWTGYAYPVVNCSGSLCGYSECINSLRVKYQEAALSGQGTAATLKEQNFRVGLYVMNYNLAVNCADAPTALSILAELGDYLRSAGCTCGCSDSVQGEPRLIPATLATSITTNLITWN